MNKLLWLLVAVPVAIVLIVFSVANRTPVTLSLDPFSPDAPAVAFTLPFFVFLFVALLAGMLLGGLATWLSQGRHRKAARLNRGEAAQWRREAEAQRNRADELVRERHGASSVPAPVGRNHAA